MSTNVFRSSAPMIFYYCLGWGETFSLLFVNCVSYISKLFSKSSSEISWSFPPFDCWQHSCNGHLYLYLHPIYLAMIIFILIFIVFFLQWSSLSLSYFFFGCRPSPCPFNCLGVCNGPQRHRPRKVLLSLPSFTENIFTTP